MVHLFKRDDAEFGSHERGVVGEILKHPMNFILGQTPEFRLAIPAASVFGQRDNNRETESIKSRLIP